MTLRKAYGFGSMVMSLLSFDGQGATFAYPGATMGAMSAAALSKASHAGDDLTAKLRDAELQASYRSAEQMGFDELIDPRETRHALGGRFAEGPVQSAGRGRTGGPHRDHAVTDRADAFYPVARYAVTIGSSSSGVAPCMITASAP